MAPANRLRGWKAGMPMAQSSLGSPGLLSAGALAAGDIATDRSFARDLNLDQIVAAIAGDREERDLPGPVRGGPRCSSSPTGSASPSTSSRQADSTLLLRAERQPDGRRDYKLAVKDPLPTSFGEDLYYRLGGWLEETEPCP